MYLLNYLQMFGDFTMSILDDVLGVAAVLIINFLFFKLLFLFAPALDKTLRRYFGSRDE